MSPRPTASLAFDRTTGQASNELTLQHEKQEHDRHKRQQSASHQRPVVGPILPGAFYLFPRAPIPDDATFVKALQDERILAVPGSGFGTPGYFRLAYCVEDRTITDALEGFRRVAQAYGLSSL